MLVSACAGTIARDNTLLPALRLAWPEVKAGAERFADGPPENLPAITAIADADRALVDSEVPETAMANVDWDLVIQMAREDILERVGKQEIGPGVGASLDERLIRFEQAVNKYLRREDR